MTSKIGGASTLGEEPINMKPENFIQPVDPEAYLYCYQVYSAAAGMKMPMESPSKKPILKDGDSVYSLSDIPMNRGMLAISKELNELDFSEQQRKSMMTRIMEFGELLDRKELSEFVKPAPRKVDIMVSAALIKACATAKMYVDEGRIGFNVADVARIAQEITDDEEQNDSSPEN